MCLVTEGELIELDAVAPVISGYVTATSYVNGSAFQTATIQRADQIDAPDGVEVSGVFPWRDVGTGA